LRLIARLCETSSKPETQHPLGERLEIPPDKFMFWRLLMKRISLVALALCTCCTVGCMGTNATCKHSAFWSEFHRKTCSAGTSVRVCLTSTMLRTSTRVALPNQRLCGVFLRLRWERGGLSRLGLSQRLCVRSEGQHRRSAVGAHHRRLCVFLARGGQWDGLWRPERGKCMR